MVQQLNSDLGSPTVGFLDHAKLDTHTREPSRYNSSERVISSSQTSVPTQQASKNTHSGLDAAIPANKRMQTYASNRKATGIVATFTHDIHTAAKEILDKQSHFPANDLLTVIIMHGINNLKTKVKR